MVLVHKLNVKLFVEYYNSSVTTLNTVLYEVIIKLFHMWIFILLLSSAGVGRSGAFIVLDIMLERIPQTHDINVLECVQELRAKRMSMVQTAVCV